MRRWVVVLLAVLFSVGVAAGGTTYKRHGEYHNHRQQGRVPRNKSNV